MSYPTPVEAFEAAIAKWEGLWEDDPSDAGNYAHCHDGTRKLIGTMRGVTPDVYADYFGMDPADVTAEDMQAKVTLEVAGQIAVKGFYLGPKFQLLTWSPLVAIAVDIGWGSGPARGIMMVQRLVGANPDGGIGPQTAALVDQYLVAHDIAAACDQLTQARVDFYMSISQAGTPNAKFRAGWINRADWYLSTNTSPCWWDAWAGWTMPVPAVTSRPDA
jgi:lysozyme family protein